jgi:hypothetical protein
LALAFAIQKSKPEEIPTNGESQRAFLVHLLTSLEYCLQLRANIQTGRDTFAANPRHIDTPEFWKEQYSKIYKEKKELEDKIHIIDEEQRLRRESDRDEFGCEAGLTISRKRQALSQDVETVVDGEDDLVAHDQDVVLRLSSYGKSMKLNSSSFAPSALSFLCKMTPFETTSYMLLSILGFQPLQMRAC